MENDWMIGTAHSKFKEYKKLLEYIKPYIFGCKVLKAGGGINRNICGRYPELKAPLLP